MDSQINNTRIIVVGGGLVGSLSACYFGQRGYTVDVYEYRQDPRSCDLVKGRSINLALSVRGREALSKVGVQPPGIPMAGRMTHPVKGKKRAIPYDPVYNQCISSVSRKNLNEVLLTEAEKFPNVNLHFGHKLVAVDFDAGKATFKNNDITVEKTGDLIVGADGAFSAVRRHMMKLPMFNFSQSYIEHGYMELSIPPTDDGEFAMDPGYLHIWPRGKFMMIALPNLDKTWTVTLFMPIAQFNELDSSSKVLTFFNQYFPDSVDLIGEKNLVQDFLSSKASHLVSVKCKPYHVGSKAVIIGDAAHAMVPFFGQGMNAGFEDCRILDDLLHNHGYSIAEALKVYSKTRNPDAEAICDLAMYNYIEMRDLVNRRTFLVRKYFDNFLYGIVPSLWIPLYQSVTFSHMSYSECTKNKKWQDKVLFQGALAVLAVAVTVALLNRFLQL